MRQLYRWLEHVRRKHPFAVDPDGFEDLAPSKNIDIAKYEKAMDYALSNPAITNIAVTGNYGSGKSSLLKTYAYQRPERRWLDISLANFDDSGKEPNETAKLIEISILQQMFYRVKHSRIPDSRFKRIRKLSHTTQWICSVLALIWIAALGILFHVKAFENVVKVDGLPGHWPETVRFSALFVFLAGAIAIVYWLVRPLRKAKFSKLNFVKGDIEIGELGKASILNEYLDEILYFFQVNDFNVVVIEDLDRFNDTAIFTRLRELNNLLNNSPQVGRRVVFVYAIKDEMFLRESRAKFFEFIVPVIPVINSGNSVDRLFDKLNATGLRSELSDHTIKAIMLYVDDMRMLKNIMNEYLLYRNILDSGLSKEHIFAMVVYKNIEPIDYANLNMNQGLVHDAFQNKPGHITALQDQHTKKIKELEGLILAAQKEAIQSVQELRLIYAYRIHKASTDGVKVGSTTLTRVEQLMTDENFEMIRTGEAKEYMQYNWKELDFAKYEKEVNPTQTYIQRENQVLVNRDKYITELQKQIADLRQEIRDVKAYTLADLTETMGLDILGEEIRKKKLLTYLLHNGLINEAYKDFISHFYEGRLTRKDRDFILNVQNQEELPPEYELTHVEEVAKDISLKEYGDPEVQNYSLLDYLLKYAYKHADQLQAMMNRLYENGAGSYAFIDGYFSRGKHADLFIKQLAKSWPGFFDMVIEQPEATAETKQAFVDTIVQHAPINTLVAIDVKKNLSKLIVADGDFLVRYGDKKYGDWIKSVITTLQVAFAQVNTDDTTEPLLGFILSQGYFALSPAMVRLILLRHRPVYVNEADWEEMIETNNYTAVQEAKAAPLEKRLATQYNEYAENVFLKMDRNHSASRAEILGFLSNDKISEKNRASMLIKQFYVFDSLNEVPVPFRNAALIGNVQPNWDNAMIAIGEETEISTGLYVFLTDAENMEKITAETLAEKAGEPETVRSLKQRFALAMAQENFPDEDYAKLLTAIDYTYPSLDFSNLNAEKIQFLIGAHKLTPTEENIDTLRELDPPMHLQLLESEMEEFLNDYPDVELEGKDYALLLRSQLDEVLKIRVLERVPLDLLAKDPSLAAGDVILHSSQGFDEELMMTMLTHEIEQSRKVHLFTHQVPYADVETLKKYIELLPEPYNSVLSNAQSKLDDSKKSREFAYALEKKRLVKVKEDEQKKVVRVWLKSGAV